MTVTDNQLFSVEDALARLAQNRDQGLLIASRAAETIQIYVQDGFVVRAQGNTREASDAVGQALSWKDASFTWLRGIQPPNPAKNLHISLIELIAKFGAAGKPKTIATGKLHSALKKDVKEAETKFRYFLVPQDRLMERIYLPTATCSSTTSTSRGATACSTCSRAACPCSTSTRPTAPSSTASSCATPRSSPATASSSAPAPSPSTAKRSIRCRN
jgi:hypothetical protein